MGVNRDRVVKLLREVGVPEYKIYHSELVADVALIVARRLKAEGHEIDVDTVHLGALLHDIGIAVTGDDLSPQHASIGANMARKHGFPEAVARCIESHELLGLPGNEGNELGVSMGRESFVPQNWEEKAVMFADHVVLAWGECEKDLWADRLCIAKACFPYTQKIYRRWAGKEVTAEHNSNHRGVRVYREMMPYLSPADLAGLEDEAEKMRAAQIAYGLQVPFPYADDLEIPWEDES
jgi:uncharacterized protein (TIGR00295 family)